MAWGRSQSQQVMEPDPNQGRCWSYSVPGDPSPPPPPFLSLWTRAWLSSVHFLSVETPAREEGCSRKFPRLSLSPGSWLRPLGARNSRQWSGSPPFPGSRVQRCGKVGGQRSLGWERDAALVWDPQTRGSVSPLAPGSLLPPP